MLSLYSIFHLNLAYSSIPESRRLEIIRRCFWPLLNLAIEDSIPIAIEAPAYTLEVARMLDQDWIDVLKKAIELRKVEFIGSGYSQLIAPLVPAQVNKWNLEIGVDTYRNLINKIPEVWFINEQAYSRGIVEHYSNLGVKGIIMEWNNPKTLHPEWNSEYRYYPQTVIGNNNETIPVLWNDSISFQKFQRYAHNDISLKEMLQFLGGHVGSHERFFCLYGNDAEIFDFRPGRFKAEPRLAQGGEWSRIRDLYHRIRDDHRFDLVLPADVLGSAPDILDLPSRIPLSLETPTHPIPVKKQPKYNVTRWQVTGRNSTWLNAQCFAIYRKIYAARKKEVFSEKGLTELKRHLCFLWSSDFRTHLVQERWTSLRKQILKTQKKLKHTIGDREERIQSTEIPIDINGLFGAVVLGVRRRKSRKKYYAGEGIDIGERFTQIITPSVDIVLNHQRGLAIESLAFPGMQPEPLIGTIKHGYFEEISLSADWYSASSVLQRPGKSQITDLEKTDPTIRRGTSSKGPWIGCVGTIITEIGSIDKEYIVYQDIPQIDIKVTFHWKKVPLGSFRSGFITLLPNAFDQSSLFYATHNGGYGMEVFKMNNCVIDHGTPSSSVVTASSGLGATEGIVVVGDQMKGIAVYFDQAVHAAMPMVSFRSADPSFFARLIYSLGEVDESRTQEILGPVKFVCSLAGLKRSGI